MYTFRAKHYTKVFKDHPERKSTKKWSMKTFYFMKDQLQT